MASYTMQLRSYIERFSQFDEGLSLAEKIEIGRPKLFDFDYPIFDPSYKKTFETNFIRNFYFREIGFETEEMFKMRLETWLEINMPYWNEMFESQQIKYDPLTNTRIDTEYDRLNDKDREENRKMNQTSSTDGNTTSNINQQADSEGKTKEDNFSRQLDSDNPDSRLAITTEDGEGVIEYASEIGENTANNEGTTEGSSTSQTDSTDTTNVDSTANQSDDFNVSANEKENFKQTRFGKVGSETYARMVMEYRQALIRVEVQVHKEMQELFMLVY